MKPVTLENAVYRSLTVKPRKYRLIGGTRRGYVKVVFLPSSRDNWRKFVDFAEERKLTYRKGLRRYLHPTLHGCYLAFGDKYVEALLAAARLTQ